MKDRIRQIMESQHMTQQVFADFIGTTPATLSGIFNDRTRPTINIVEAIKKKLPDINTDWLMFGTGPMYRSSTGVTEGPEAATPARQPMTLFDQEAAIDFGAPQPPAPARPASVREEPKAPEKPQRHVTEIRVYYDDQTWESFVPSKK